MNIVNFIKLLAVVLIDMLKNEYLISNYIIESG